METFVSRQNVSNGRGSIKYITKDSDGKILATYSTQSENEWNILFDFNRKKFEEEKAKGTKFCNQKTKNGKLADAMEAKMIVVALPNELLKFPYELENRRINSVNDLIKYLADDWTKTHGTDCYIALHLNDKSIGKDKTNLHMHLLASNRKKKDSPELKRANRNRYYDSNGKECAKKNAVRIVHKGDIIRGQNELYESGKIDLESAEARQQMYTHYSRLLGTKLFIKDGLHVAQQHLPRTNARSSPDIIKKVNQIKKHNEAVAEYNRNLDLAIQKGANLAPFKRQVVAYKANRKQKKDTIFDLLSFALKVLKEVLKPTPNAYLNKPKTALGRYEATRKTGGKTINHKTLLGRATEQNKLNKEPIIVNRDYTKQR